MSDKKRGAAKAGEGKPSEAPVGQEQGQGKASGRKRVDWDALEPHYRAGIRSLKDIAAEFGCSDAAIVKHAKEKGWTRDLQAKIKARAEAKVAAQVSATQVSAEVSTQTRQREEQVIEANATVVADADLLNRSDVMRGLSLGRSLLEEVEILSRPQFAEALEMIAQANYSPNRAGQDPLNEMYRYIISLAGRVKMAKDLAAFTGVYIPMQRKILKLDEEADKNKAAVDDLLRKINQGA